MFEKLLSICDRGEPADIFTVIGSSKPQDTMIGKMIIMDRHGQTYGECAELSRRAADKIKDTVWLKPSVIEIQGACGTVYRIYWDRLVSKHKAVIFGGGHISQPLAQILGLLQFQVTVVDDRPEFANKARFAAASQVICASFTQAFSQVVIDNDTAVIIVTRGHRHDLDCLRATVNCQARYWGMIGSRRRVKEIVSLLQAEGVAAGRLQQLKAPIGLDIGAETPAEIAVSIAAEVISVFRERAGASLSSKERL